jgi:flagellar hook assembly protein FlgD
MYVIGTEDATQASAFELQQNSPNPFSDRTSIRFSLPYEQAITLTIFDILGNIVFEQSAVLAAGAHMLTWDGTDKNGKAMASGYYFYRLQAESGMVTRKMTLMK